MTSKASGGVDEEEGEPIEMLVMDRNQLKERILQNKGGVKKSARDLFFGKGAKAVVVPKKKKTKIVDAEVALPTPDVGGAVARKRIIGGVMMDIPIDQEEAGPKLPAIKEKRKLNRLWRPSAEYKMVREGPVLSCHPDEHPHLQEHMMTIFKNTNPEVSFAEDPNTPLWIGVLKLDSRFFDYGVDDGFYDPKLPHLKVMYAERPAKKFPADNMALPMDGGEPLPYWVDKFKLNKDKEKSQKQKSKNKKKLKLAAEEEGVQVKQPPPPPPRSIPHHHQEEEEEEEDGLGNTRGGAFSSVGGIPGLEAFSEPNDVNSDDDDDDDVEPAPVVHTNSKKRTRKPVADDEESVPNANRENLLVQANGIPDFERYVFPLAGWMYTTTMMKGASKQIISKSSILKPSPAERLAKTGDQTLKHIGRSNGGGGGGGEAFVIPAAAAVPKPAPIASKTEERKIATGERAIPMLDIRLSKHSFVSAQLQAFKEHSDSVNPLFRAYFLGAKGPDPTELLTDFIDFLDEKK